MVDFVPLLEGPHISSTVRYGTHYESWLPWVNPIDRLPLRFSLTPYKDHNNEELVFHNGALPIISVNKDEV